MCMCVWYVCVSVCMWVRAGEGGWEEKDSVIYVVWIFKLYILPPTLISCDIPRDTSQKQVTFQMI